MYPSVVCVCGLPCASTVNSTINSSIIYGTETSGVACGSFFVIALYVVSMASCARSLARVTGGAHAEKAQIKFSNFQIFDMSPYLFILKTPTVLEPLHSAHAHFPV